MILKTHNICSIYDNNTVLNNISVEFTEGIYGIIGKNGCGKTTFLRILASVLKPDIGIVTLDNKDISLLDYKYRKIIGYVPQNFGLYNNYTIEKFLMYIASLKGLNKKESIDRVNRLMQSANIYEFRNKKIGKLSEGTKKRIVIAQALLNDPKILILDEPAGELDIEGKRWLIDTLHSFSKEKIVILSTHIESEIEGIAKNIYKLENGVLYKRCG